MDKEPQIWFDFTTSLHWTRPAVGVVRVEQECCRWLLLKLGDRVRPCVFDQSTSQLLEFDRQDAWRILSRNTIADTGPAKGAMHIDPPLSPPAVSSCAPRAGMAKRIEKVLRKLAVALLARMPEKYQPALRRYMVAVRRTMAYGYQEWNAARAARNTPPPIAPAPLTVAPPATSRPAAKFGAGDVYLTMGLDWDHNKLDFLYREKKRTGVKVLNFAYDIIPVKFPHYYPSGKFDLFSVYFATMGWTADMVICISQCTARDLGQFLDEVGVPRPPMTVVRLGDALPVEGTMQPSAEVSELLKEPFLLAVSTIEIRKNHETLYRAFLRLIESGLEVPKLVFVGMMGWRVDDFVFSLRNDPRVADRIVILDHVSDADLSTLYRTCLFTLYPSLYEGWGLPVAESLSYGKFCLASNAASIPEIAGDIIDYADPWNVPLWAEKIWHYCSNPLELHKREQLIASRYRLTSWETTADQMIAAVDRVSPGAGE